MSVFQGSESAVRGVCVCYGIPSPSQGDGTMLHHLLGPVITSVHVSRAHAAAIRRTQLAYLPWVAWVHSRGTSRELSGNENFPWIGEEGGLGWIIPGFHAPLRSLLDLPSKNTAFRDSRSCPASDSIGVACVSPVMVERA